MREIFKNVSWNNNGRILRGSMHLPDVQDPVWIVFSHGFTSHRLGPGYFFVRLSRAFSASGIASLRFDYFGTGESDGEFTDLSIEGMCSDLDSAVDFLRKEQGARKIIIFGHSLGGAVTAMAAGRTNPDGLILLAPVAEPKQHMVEYKDSLKTGVNRRGNYEIGPFEISNGFISSVERAEPVREITRNHSGRVLLFQGGSDRKVGRSEAEEYISALKKNGVDVDYYFFKEAGHRFSNVKVREKICSTIIKWTTENYK